MPVLGIIASQISGHLWAPEGAYDSLATVTLSAATASITFAGIPTGYKHLQIRGIAKSAGSGTNGDMTINGDTGNNYAWHELGGNGAVAYTSASASRANIANVFDLNASTNTNIFGASIIDILDYANTSKNKTVRTIGGTDLNGSGGVALWSGLWMNTAAITSITITGRSANIAQYSSFALYGVK